MLITRLDVIEPITLPKGLCETLLTIGENPDTEWRRPYNDLPTNTFDILNLDNKSRLYQALQQELGDPIGYKFTELRLHRWTPEHCARRHVDNYLPNHETLIVRLDSYGESRLLAADELMYESQGVGYWLPEGTPHEVIQGDHTRYSLVGWGQTKSTIKLTN